jgi:Poly(A) polymerase catalytic subunit
MKNICDKSMSFQECELAILRSAIDKAEERSGRAVANSTEVKKIIGIVENFIRRKKVICYGGTAINNILPKQDQFYNTEVEIPDYDFFSPNALNDSKELTDDYVNAGFLEVEAKSGQHKGTYKVFVNFIPVADITFLHKEIYKSVRQEAIKVDGILYAPPNYLRMSMYLELSRPAGDVSRWEKVLKRLTLLNKNYPLKSKHCDDIEQFQREMINKEDEDKIFEITRNSFINQGVVFFGGYAISLYLHYMPRHLHKKLEKIPDFDVLSEDPKKTAEILRERLRDAGYKTVKIIKRKEIGEIVAPHYQIMVGSDTIAFIYKPIACHSYNVITVDKQPVKIATIDTMLSFYLAFLYSDRNYYDSERIVCMAQFLFEVQQKNRLQQKGLLRRFSISCYGHQETVEEMRAEKAEKFKELKDHKKKQSAEYEEWFLRYRPADDLSLKEKKKQERKLKKSKTATKKTKNNETKKRGRGGLFY